MSESIESLKRSLNSVASYINDHDYICECRPVDVRAVKIIMDCHRRLYPENYADHGKPITRSCEG